MKNNKTEKNKPDKRGKRRKNGQKHTAGRNVKKEVKVHHLHRHMKTVSLRCLPALAFLSGSSQVLTEAENRR